MVGTGADTLTAADTQLAVVIHDIPGPVVAHFRGADHDAAMAVNTFIFQYMNNRPQVIYFHLYFSLAVYI
jgi:hypothetical protein